MKQAWGKSIVLVFGIALIGTTAHGGQMSCGHVKALKYQPSANGLDVELDRMIETKTSNFNFLRLYKSSEKLKAKMAITRPGSFLCFIENKEGLKVKREVRLVQAQDIEPIEKIASK